MSPREMDGLFEAGRLPVDLSAERVDRIMRNVLNQLDELPPRPWWKAWREWVFVGAPTLSLGRFAAVLTIAALLGVAVGSHFDATDSSTQISNLFSSTTLFRVES